jgi:succinate dehydrogenase flavin-adding protein (antitoxin of CptAB toxin-antitoxin module)
LIEIKLDICTDFKTLIKNYLDKKNTGKLYDTANIINKINDTLCTNSNNGKLKYLLFSSDSYSTNMRKIDEVDNAFTTITNYVKSDMKKILENEKKNFDEILKLEKNELEFVKNLKNSMTTQVQKLSSTINTISKVMFSEYFRKSAFLKKDKLVQKLGECIQNFETIIQMNNNVVYDVITRNNQYLLSISQINNYVSFKGTINRTIQGQNIVTNFYKTMSFGIAEFYKDILSAIITCLENKKFEQMSEIEAYLYQFHYISLKRCYYLFKWINEDYIRKKQSEEDEERLRGDVIEFPIINKKIDTMNSKGDINAIFLEFHGLKRLLDEYNAAVMDRVQIHMRINDFRMTKTIKDYNDKTKQKATANGTNVLDLEYLIDYDVTSKEYLDKWNHNRFVFENKNEKNVLEVNFDAMDKIYKFENDGEEKEFDKYYHDIYVKMKPNMQGIRFNRIYNTLQFPDSDVIANYMSIAPNILSNKGTVIMTYGYSGVGKSASLFGRPPSGEDPGSNGILQATLGYFSSVEIYFRVYEIYGLGTQYNYYWNPKDNGNYDCYPPFYQCIIHHVLDTSGSTLKINDSIVFTNRHDMLNYVLNLVDPTLISITVKNINDPNLGGKSGYSTYFDPTGGMLRSTYVKINQNHYNNFNGFIDNLESNRASGKNIKRLFTHLIRQVKGTVNNKDSSRSILVYDFQINTNPTSTNKIFVPFLIYDLPGKEDIARTYIKPDVDDVPQSVRSRVYRDIPDDISKAEKSTFVLNPMLMSIFRDNNEKIIQLITSISSVGTGTVKIDAGNETAIVNKIINMDITNFGYNNDGEYVDNMTPYKLFPEIYSTAPTNFVELYDKGRLLSFSGDDLYNFYYKTGIIGQYELNGIDLHDEIFVLVSILLLAELIKFNYFDIVVEIINFIVGNGSDDPSDGNWTKDKIYAFFEAYYINENVIGLLQFLIKDVLKRSDTGIPPQSTITENIEKTVSKNYKIANKYRILYNSYELNENGEVANDYNLNVNNQLIDTTIPENNDPLRIDEIDKFVDDNDIDTTYGIFAQKGDPLDIALERISNVIDFENKGLYNSNRIFRNGEISTCSNVLTPGDQDVLNPFNDTQQHETNRPLLQDLLEPYQKKILFYYLFYVVSNNQPTLKAEEQIKLINNSMPFINKMNIDPKKKQCAQ